MEDVIMRSVESLDGSNAGDKCDTPKGSLNDCLDSPSKSLPKYFYSKELLVKLKNHPQSKQKPVSFDSSDFVSKTGLWDPEHWHSRTAKDSKRPTSGSISLGKEEQQEKKRGKEEGDEFSFTPQRRSFVSGCHVTPTRRQETETAPIPEPREVTLASRRVGSGRIGGRDADPIPPVAKDIRDRREPIRATGQRERVFEREPPRSERNDRSERPYNNNGRPDPRDKGLDKDRRNFERSGFDRDRDFGRGGRHQRNKMEDDTPEWFHDGPASQHDTIELRGFDEEKDKGKSTKAAPKKTVQSAGGKKGEEGLVNGSSSSRPGSSLSDKKDGKTSSADQQNRRKSPTNEDKMDFNIEDFLKMDADNLGLMTSENEEVSRSSKASRWFGKTSDVSEADKPAQKGGPSANSGKEDAARSLLEMLQKGSSQAPEQHNKKVLTAEELERSSGHSKAKERSTDDGMAVFNKLLAQVQEGAPKPRAMMGNAPTEQDILANLLGNKMKMDSHPHQQNQQGPQHQHQAHPPPQDALAKFLQQQQNNHVMQQNAAQPNSQMFHMQHQQQHPFQAPAEHQQQQHPDVQALMRDVANGLHPQALNQLHLMAMQHQQHQQQQQQQQQHNQQQQRQNFTGSPQQSNKPTTTSSSSPLSFTPTAVMRKMTAEKDKNKSSSLDKGDGGEPGSSTASSPPANTGSATTNRLTGRTASQVQGASRVSNQLGMSDGPMAQQQQLLTGRPLVKGQEGILPFQQGQPMGSRPPFPQASNAAITGVAVKMLEQQQQHQLLAAAMAATANQQTQQQLKQLQQQQLLQQQQQQQQRTSPLPQSLMALAGLQSGLGMQNRGIPPNVPVGNRTHFRPIHPQPMIPPVTGYSPFLGNQSGQPGQNRPPSGMPASNQFYGAPPSSNMRGQAQGLNALAALHQQYSGSRSPNNVMPGGNPLARWFPPEILSQAGGQMPAFPPMPSQKILSLEELERLHATPLSH